MLLLALTVSVLVANRGIRAVWGSITRSTLLCAASYGAVWYVGAVVSYRRT